MIVTALVYHLAAERGGQAWIEQITATCDQLFREAPSTSNSTPDSEQFRADAAARVKTMLKGN
jgi:hypothetical protein